MIVEPERYRADFAKSGADHLIIHAEASATIHLHRVLGQLRELGKKAGVALNPDRIAGSRWSACLGGFRIAKVRGALDQVDHMSGGPCRQRVMRGARARREVGGHLTGQFELPIRGGGE